MAGVSPWLAAAVALLPPLALAVVLCARGSLEQRFAALQLTGAIAVVLLVVLTFVLQEASSMDLALTLSLLTLPATLLYAVFVERWL